MSVNGDVWKKQSQRPVDQFQIQNTSFFCEIKKRTLANIGKSVKNRRKRKQNELIGKQRETKMKKVASNLFKPKVKMFSSFKQTNSWLALTMIYT